MAETHLSCQTQKQTSHGVIPHFTGEIGLNTDILQMAHVALAHTGKIEVGSAIRNIICNGGPIAHAEAVRAYLSLRDMVGEDSRKLHLGFAAGRFPFSNVPYGFYPKTNLEKHAWDICKSKYFHEATEIFLRLLKAESISSQMIAPRSLSPEDFRESSQWERAIELAKAEGYLLRENQIQLKNHWDFEILSVIPKEVSLENLVLTLGSHDPSTQELANKYLPVGVFNLSITPPKVIEETHQRMSRCYHVAGGPWQREYMPRTVMLFMDDSAQKATEQAEKAWMNYWKAMDGTLDPQKVKGAVQNTIAGTPEQVIEQLAQKYHPQDRLMLWFDFNNHDNEKVSWSMRQFMEKVAPALA